MGDFERTYVSANNHASAPAYDAVRLESIVSEMCGSAPELVDIRNAVMTALAVGAHRADLVPQFLSTALSGLEGNEAEAAQRFEQFRSTIMVVWPFVGIPWCVPACMGMAHILKSHDLLHIAERRLRTEDVVDAEDKARGAKLLERTYATVSNDEVRRILRTYFADFSSLTWSVIFGFCLAGTTATGVFEEKQTQLLVAAAIASSGATRQTRSHLTAAMGLGSSTQAAKAVWTAAEQLNEWNLTHLNPIDVDGLAADMEVARGAKAVAAAGKA